MSNEKIIINEEGEEINLSELERKFGGYGCEGATYYATGQMKLNKRVFAGDFNDPDEKGEEMEEENLNWFKDADRVVRL